MSLTAAQSVPDASDYAVASLPATQEIRSSRRFEENEPQIFTLQQRHFVVGGQHLVLDEFPQIAVFPGKYEFEIVDWNLRLAYGQQDQIAREMIRKFLHLFAKAEQMTLGQDEEAEWASIVKHVDYKRFSIERSPHRYVEGILLENNTGGCSIQWNDSTKEKVKEPVSLPFKILEPGERFKAFAKFGPENVLQDITGLMPLSQLSNEDGEKMWQEWPITT